MNARLGELIDAAAPVAPAEAARMVAMLDALTVFSPPENRDLTMQYLRDMTPQELMDAVKPLMALLPDAVKPPEGM